MLLECESNVIHGFLRNKFILSLWVYEEQILVKNIKWMEFNDSTAYDLKL